MCKENIEALDELLDLTIESQNTAKYALVFEKITKAIPEKVLKYTFCPNEKVHLFEKKKGIFLIKDDAKNYINSTHEEGKNSLYVYGDGHLLKIHEKKKSSHSK